MEDCDDDEDYDDNLAVNDRSLYKNVRENARQRSGTYKIPTFHAQQSSGTYKIATTPLHKGLDWS